MNHPEHSLRLRVGGGFLVESFGSLLVACAALFGGPFLDSSRLCSRSSMSSPPADATQADLAPAAAQSPPAQQENTNRKRIELKLRLVELLNVSTLQVMSSQRGSESLSGSLRSSSEDTAEQRMATGRSLVDMLDDEVAINVLRNAGYLEPLLDAAWPTFLEHPSR